MNNVQQGEMCAPGASIEEVGESLNAILDNLPYEEAAAISQWLEGFSEVVASVLGNDANAEFVDTCFEAAAHLAQAVGHILVAKRAIAEYGVNIGVDNTVAFDATLAAGRSHPGLGRRGMLRRLAEKYPIVTEEIDPIVKLSDEQRANVRSRVRVEVVFTAHGRPKIEGKRFTLGAVTDEAYNVCDEALAAIDPNQGDVLAVEGHEHPEYNSRGKVSRIEGYTEGEAELAKLRRSRAIDAFDYVEGLAAARITPAFWADASVSELNSWRAQQSLASAAAGVAVRVISGANLHDSGFRERCAAAKIAGLAERMSRADYFPGGRRPVLKVFFGRGHIKGLSAALQEAGIEPDISEFKIRPRISR